MSGRTILYVEDNEANRMIVRDLLKRTTYELIEAFDGEAGVAKALEARPDLILMDIQLPKISGLDAIKRCGGIQALKYLLTLRGFAIGTAREPIAPLSPAARTELEHLDIEYGKGL